MLAEVSYYLKAHDRQDVAQEVKNSDERFRSLRTFGDVSNKGPKFHPARGHTNQRTMCGQGIDVRDEDGYKILFNDLGSAFLSMTVVKFCDSL